MQRLYIHPLPVRIWHWINAVGFVLMVLTGLQIRYVGLINVVSFRTAVAVHNTVGFVLIANFFVWLGFYLFSDRIKAYQSELNPIEAFCRHLPADLLLCFRHIAGRAQSVSRNHLSQVQSAAEHDLPARADAAASRSSSIPAS